MIAWSSFLIVSTLAYIAFVAMISCLCLSKLRKNSFDYICRGKRQADQAGEMSEQDKKNVEQAKIRAEERNENECAICLTNPMGGKKVLMMCAHGYCSSCLIEYIHSKNLDQVECPKCRKVCTFLIMTDEGESGPSEPNKQFIRTYNSRLLTSQGPIVFIENFPYIVHRFALDILDSYGLVLLEWPTFYVAIFFSFYYITNNMSGSFGDTLYYLLNWFDDMGVMVFLFFSFFG